MPTERLSMRHIREVLRLTTASACPSSRRCPSLGLAHAGTVSKYLNRTRRAGLTWPLRWSWMMTCGSRTALSATIGFAQRPSAAGLGSGASQLRRPGVTLMPEEYCDTTSDGFSYSWFCERYKEWAGRLAPTLRQVHVAGEKALRRLFGPHHGGDRWAHR